MAADGEVPSLRFPDGPVTPPRHMGVSVPIPVNSGLGGRELGKVGVAPVQFADDCATAAPAQTRPHCRRPLNWGQSWVAPLVFCIVASSRFQRRATTGESGSRAQPWVPAPGARRREPAGAETVAGRQPIVAATFEEVAVEDEEPLRRATEEVIGTRYRATPSHLTGVGTSRGCQQGCSVGTEDTPCWTPSAAPRWWRAGRQCRFGAATAHRISVSLVPLIRASHEIMKSLCKRRWGRRACDQPASCEQSTGELVDALLAAGALVIEIAPYTWAPAADRGAAVRLVHALVSGEAERAAHPQRFALPLRGCRGGGGRGRARACRDGRDSSPRQAGPGRRSKAAPLTRGEQATWSPRSPGRPHRVAELTPREQGPGRRRAGRPGRAVISTGGMPWV